MQSNPYAPPSAPPQGPAQSASTLAIVTLVAGLGSWIILPFFASCIGAITGWIELKNIRAGRSPEAGLTMTQVGFWASIANLALSIGTGCLVAAFYLGLLSLFGIGALAGS